jgi:1-deoxy-D-xylulose-5-phosphate synthase
LIPSARKFASKAEEHIKGMVAPGTLFEELGFNYIGPMDGHNVKEIIRTLRNLNDTSGPKLLHLITKKGKGFKPAEVDPIGFHAITKMENPNASKKKNVGMKYSDVFGSWLTSKANIDPSLIAITPAMKEGSGMVEFADKFPSRFYDVAIAEQHAMTFAAGLACEGKKPVLAIYSTFLQRAYDQLIHDVAIQNLDLLIAIDRAGLVGADGPTHAGSFDITFLSTLPNFVVMAASDESELVKMINTSVDINDRPSAFRYPRGTGFGITLPDISEKIEIGKGRIIQEGKKIALINFGARLNECKIAAQNLEKKGLSITIVDARFCKPLDENLMWQVARNHEILISIEEGSIGGFGSHLSKFLSDKSLLEKIKFRSMILPDRFIEHNDPKKMYEEAGLDSQAIENKIYEIIDSKILAQKQN